MTKPESEWTWKELPVGSTMLEPGNADQYRTGDWKTLKPVLNKELCVHCGLCYIFCPDMSYSLDAEGYLLRTFLLQGLWHLCERVSHRGDHHGAGREGGVIMAKRVGMEVSIAAAEAVKQCNVDVISAYPITPQTHVVEHLSELVANGELDSEFFCVESEHSALSVCVGAAATGARSFTCTSSQGLALMSEITYIASALRLTHRHDYFEPHAFCSN